MPRERSQFRRIHSISKRCEVSAKLRNKYPNMLPVILETGGGVPVTLEKTRYLVPSGTTVGKLLYEIRRDMRLRPEQAVFLMTEAGVMPPTGYTMLEVYERHANHDGFLYLLVSNESVFGFSPECIGVSSTFAIMCCCMVFLREEKYNDCCNCCWWDEAPRARARQEPPPPRLVNRANLQRVRSFTIEPQTPPKVPFDNICCICIDNVSEPQILLSCGHAYHSECVYDWVAKCRQLHRDAHCPMCKHNIVTREKLPV